MLEEGRGCEGLRLIVIFKFAEMESQSKKQRTYSLENGIEFDSHFQSGNLSSVLQKDNCTFHLSVEADPHSTYKTWFYFSVRGMAQGSTFSFVIVNMSNQVKLFKEGHVPVFKSEEEPRWGRIRTPLQQNGVAKGEEGFELTFKHTFSNKSKHYFAFSYPWTYSDCNSFIRQLVEANKEKYFCDYRPLCLTTKKLDLNILTVTKLQQKSLDVKQFEGLEKFTSYVFKDKKGILISARVHPGEVASSHILNGFLKFIFSRCAEAQKLLQKCVFYVIPMLNPDGVVEGNFRCDSLGHNLNRFYTEPSREKQPEIFGVKAFVVGMIRAGRVHFCLDLHAHVNKQGAFMYGNSTGSLREQVQVCLFPKLLEYNCRFFDYESCNFSEKNMSSKDRGDELSKEGASRVTFFKETALASCWTLECNYNSSRLTNELPKEAEEQASVKPVSHGILLAANDPPKKEELVLLNVKEFEEIGRDIATTILDYYRWRTANRFTNTLLKNWTNFQLSLAVRALRMIPFRFDNDCRRLLNNINSGQCLNDAFSRILDKLALGPLAQYLSPKEAKEKSREKDRDHRERERKAQSQKAASHTSLSINVVERKSTQAKTELKTNLVHIVPNIPKIPRKK